MGEYVININWNGGGGGKGNTTPNNFLAGAATTAALSRKRLLPDLKATRVLDENSIEPNTFYGVNDTQDGITKQWEIMRQGVVLSQLNLFFWGRKKVGTKTGTAYGDYNSMQDIPKTEWQWDKGDVKQITTITNRRAIAYTAAQGLRIATKIVSTHYQYASAIASSTAELNAVNEYQNAMTGIGLAGSIAAGAAIGAKVGGPTGAGIGAVVGASFAVANRAISTATENRILNYKQAINATTSAYQLGVLGDATYGRSRQSIG